MHIQLSMINQIIISLMVTLQNRPESMDVTRSFVLIADQMDYKLIFGESSL